MHKYYAECGLLMQVHAGREKGAGKSLRLGVNIEANELHVIIPISVYELISVPSYLFGISAVRAKVLEPSLSKSIMERAARTQTQDPSIIFGSFTPTRMAGNSSSTGSLK